MKYRALSLLLAMAAGSLCMAGDIRVGDSLETVVAALGEPEGYIRIDDQGLLYYERGRVELRDGHVVSAALISPEAAEERRLERIRENELARQAAIKRAAEGQVLRDRKLNDPAFLAQSAAARAAYWQAFMRSYPGVAVGMDYEAAQRELQAEAAALRAKEEHLRQYAELQERAAMAEQRAAEAEARARQSYLTFASYSYPTSYRSSRFERSSWNPLCPPEPTGRRMKQERGHREWPTTARVSRFPQPRGMTHRVRNMDVGVNTFRRFGTGVR